MNGSRIYEVKQISGHRVCDFLDRRAAELPTQELEWLREGGNMYTINNNSNSNGSHCIHSSGPFLTLLWDPQKSQWLAESSWSLHSPSPGVNTWEMSSNAPERFRQEFFQDTSFSYIYLVSGLFPDLGILILGRKGETFFVFCIDDEILHRCIHSITGHREPILTLPLQFAQKLLCFFFPLISLTLF